MLTKSQLSAEFDKKFTQEYFLKLVDYSREIIDFDKLDADIKSFFFSQIDKILDEMVLEEIKHASGISDYMIMYNKGFSKCRQDILNKIKEYAGNK